MLVTNTTAHCFVLSAGVVIRPNASNVSVSDATYQADSTLNQQLDALEAEGFVSISGKPADSFPPAVQSDVDGQVVLSASAADKLPLKLVAHNGQTAAVLEVVDGDGAKLFQVLPDGVQLYADDNGGNYNTFYTGVGGSGVNQADAASPAFQIWAQAGASANLFEVYDEHGTLIGSLEQAAGTVEDDNPTIFTMRAAAGSGHANLSGGGQDYGGALFLHQADGTRCISLFTDPTQMSMQASTGQTQDLLELRDEDGNLVVKVTAAGVLHIKTGTTIHADL